MTEIAFEQIVPAMSAINTARRQLDEGANRDQIRRSLDLAAKHIRLIRYYWDKTDPDLMREPPDM